MVAAEAGTGDDERRIGILLEREGQQLVDEVPIVLIMAPGSFVGGPPPGVPAFTIDAVGTNELSSAGGQRFAQRCDQTAIFPIVETADRSWKGQNAWSGVTKDEEFHVAERRAVPTMIRAFHELYG